MCREVKLVPWGQGVLGRREIYGELMKSIGNKCQLSSYRGPLRCVQGSEVDTLGAGRSWPEGNIWAIDGVYR